MQRKTVAVLGAGIQGACVALALAARGQRVYLVDRMPRPMLRASLRNEGKVHLGFVYANDPSHRSSDLMLASALSFAPLMDSWLPAPIDWDRLRSRPFTYLIMRDTMVAADDLRSHYERLADAYREHRHAGGSYLGARPDRLFRTVDTPAFVDPGVVLGAVETAEAALDLPRFRRHVVDALDAHESIHWFPGHEIESVARAAAGLTVAGRELSTGSPWRHDVDAVVNCLWEGRLAIDAQMAASPLRAWVHRLKYRVIGRLPASLGDLPSLTLVLGPYGDVVPFDGASYFSWYPACRRGWSSAITVPPEWEGPCNGDVAPEVRETVAAEVFRGLDGVIPGIRDACATAVDAGVVFSWGETDIENPESILHERFAVGVHGGDGYYSIDTGKLTCAPLFAQRLTQLLT